MSNRAVHTHSALVSSALFSPTLLLHLSFHLLPLSSLESKVKPSSVEVENSKILKTSDRDPVPCLPSLTSFSLPFFLSVYIPSLCVPLYLSFPVSLKPSLPLSFASAGR